MCTDVTIMTGAGLSSCTHLHTDICQSLRGYFLTIKWVVAQYRALQAGFWVGWGLTGDWGRWTGTPRRVHLV